MIEDLSAPWRKQGRQIVQAGLGHTYPYATRLNAGLYLVMLLGSA